ncbi:calmodulin [Stylonychia lemnae]|uniref:Calmodulin n=1 Tax=Stylonychia lemnae TaxID=5949 RepID=A0A078ANQ4_STYLE|nr:calmodulin [Stylonychia lemnae]|eukprot:CDW82598.1 calmodulin [Stylonychia lemnae]
MIKAEEFTAEELQAIIQQLGDFKDQQTHLQEQVGSYFQNFDKDSNGFLDRKELREFLTNFFTQYKIHFPVTDEYVDAVFREIDLNRDNKIQPNELESYALHFVNTILPHYEQALSTKQ